MPMLLDPTHPEQLDRVIKSFAKGEPVGLPTETVYGLAAPIDNLAAIARVFHLKGRPEFNPLIVHVLHRSQARDYARWDNPLVDRLLEGFWPGSLSLLLDKKESVPDLVTSGSQKVVLRCPRHQVFRTILSRSDRAMVAPSANRYKQISPVTSKDVIEELGPYGLEAVLEGGRCESGIESTIVEVGTDTIEILRPGAVTKDDLKKALGDAVEVNVSQAKTPKVPGAQKKHYSPHTPLFFTKASEVSRVLEKDKLQGKRLALFVLLKKDLPEKLPAEFERTVLLSEDNSLTEAASEFYTSLRALDKKGFDGIVAVRTVGRGLGLALNDRLKRAASDG